MVRTWMPAGVRLVPGPRVPVLSRALSGLVFLVPLETRCNVNMDDQEVMNRAVAETFDLPYKDTLTSEQPRPSADGLPNFQTTDFKPLTKKGSS